MESAAEIRASEKGKEKRKEQSRRYREHVRGRKEQEAVDEAARVISLDFFRWFLRPTRVLSGVRPQLAITPATLLFEAVPACGGAGGGAGTAMARAAEDRRALRALSLAPAGSGTCHGAVAGALRSTVAGGGVPARGRLVLLHRTEAAKTLPMPNDLNCFHPTDDTHPTRHNASFHSEHEILIFLYFKLRLC